MNKLKRLKTERKTGKKKKLWRCEMWGEGLGWSERENCGRIDTD